MKFDEFSFLYSNKNRTDLVSKHDNPNGEIVEDVLPIPERVQLESIVQPVAFVPYTTRDQEIYMKRRVVKEEPKEEKVEEEKKEEAVEKKEEVVAKKSSFKILPLFVAILGILAAAVMICGKYIPQIATYLAIANGNNGIDTLVNIYNQIVANSFFTPLGVIVPIAIVLFALATIVTIVSAICAMFVKGGRIAIKVTTILMFVFSVVAIGYAHYFEKVFDNVGLIIEVGLSVISVILAYATKNN